jgi:hypothetical protein
MAQQNTPHSNSRRSYSSKCAADIRSQTLDHPHVHALSSVAVSTAIKSCIIQQNVLYNEGPKTVLIPLI